MKRPLCYLRCFECSMHLCKSCLASTVLFLRIQVVTHLLFSAFAAQPGSEHTHTQRNKWLPKVLNHMFASESEEMS